MDIINKVTEAVKGVGEKPAHKHTLADDAWSQFVSIVGPKLAQTIWAALPDAVKETAAKNGARYLVHILSLYIARKLPDDGLGPFIDRLQTEVAGELREIAEKYEKGEKSDGGGGVSRSAPGPTSAAGYGAEGTEQILRLELVRVNRIIIWLACAASAKVDPKDILDFLNGLTLRELRNFADMEDAAKQTYVEARIRKPIPKVASEPMARKFANWFGKAWDEVKNCAEKADADLEGVALSNDDGIKLLEGRIARLREEAAKPLGEKAWEFWKL